MSLKLRIFSISILISSLMGCAAPAPRPNTDYNGSNGDVLEGAAATISGVAKAPYGERGDKQPIATLGKGGETRSQIVARCHVYFKNDPTDNSKFCRNFRFVAVDDQGKESKAILPSDDGSFIVPAAPERRYRIVMRAKSEWEVSFSPDRALKAGDIVDVKLTQHF